MLMATRALLIGGLATMTLAVDGVAQSKELLASFNATSDFIVKSAEMVPDDRYTYRPTPAVRTFLQLIAHIADGNNYYCANAGGRSVEWSDPLEKSVTTKAQAIDALRKSVSGCQAVYGAASSRVSPLIDNLTHDNQHYGNIVVYLRLMGFTPPSS